MKRYTGLWYGGPLGELLAMARVHGAISVIERCAISAETAASGRCRLSASRISPQ